MTEFNNINPAKGRRAAAVIAGSALTLSSVAFGAPAAFAENDQQLQKVAQTQATDHDQSNEAGQLEITPSSTDIRAGDSFTVKGTGFTPYDDVQLRIGNEILSNGYATEKGDIDTEITIREDFEPGGYSLAAIDYGSDETAYADVEVLEKSDDNDETEADPDFDINSDDFAPGERIKASGEGFTPERSVRYSIDFEGRTVDEFIHADEKGNASRNLVVPEDTGEGTYEITGTDEETGKQDREEFAVSTDD